MLKTKGDPGKPTEKLLAITSQGIYLVSNSTPTPPWHHASPLPYSIQQAVGRGEGDTLFLRDRLQPRRITQVKLNPFQVRSFWVNTPIVHMMAASWSWGAATTLGRLWLFTPQGEPLAQIEAGDCLQILALDDERRVWIRTSQLLHTSDKSATTGEPAGWIQRLDLSSLPQ